MKKIIELKKQINLAEENLRKALDEYYEEVKKGNYLKDLNDYAGKELLSIKVIMENDEIVELNDFEILEVTNDGYLNISDFYWGLLKYDSKENIYNRWLHYSKTAWNIKGFFDVRVYNDEDENENDDFCIEF